MSYQECIQKHNFQQRGKKCLLTMSIVLLMLLKQLLYLYQIISFYSRHLCCYVYNIYINDLYFHSSQSLQARLTTEIINITNIPQQLKVLPCMLFVCNEQVIGEIRLNYIIQPVFCLKNTNHILHIIHQVYFKIMRTIILGEKVVLNHFLYSPLRYIIDHIDRE